MFLTLENGFPTAPEPPLLIWQNCAVVAGDMAGGMIAALHFSNFPERRLSIAKEFEQRDRAGCLVRS
jgi:hypothetical protein